jgi:hypothetical protein
LERESEGAQCILRKLLWLDADELLPEGLSRVWD